MNKNFNVRFVPASVPKEYEKNKLLVKNIPEGVNEDVFVVFVESCLNLDIGESLHVDFRKTCALLSFTQPYSDEGIVISFTVLINLNWLHC